MQIVTGCLCPTPTLLLPTIAGIAPAKLRRDESVYKLAVHAITANNHLLSRYIPVAPHELPRPRLKSRKLFFRHAADLLASRFDILQSWSAEWESVHHPPQLGVCPDIRAPAGASLPRKLWVTLNRLRYGVGKFGANMLRWGIRDSALCEGEYEEQTAEHIIHHCRVLHPPTVS